MRSRGFTLLELMVVLGIIAILALLAIPTYQDKFIRDQIAEAIPLADKIVNNFIKSVAMQGGAIHITFGNHAHSAIAGKVLTLRPAVVEDAVIVPVTWVCGYASAPEKMTLKGENKTNLPPGYLPVRCRQ